MNEPPGKQRDFWDKLQIIFQPMGAGTAQLTRPIDAASPSPMATIEGFTASDFMSANMVGDCAIRPQKPAANSSPSAPPMSAMITDSPRMMPRIAAGV